MSRKTPYRGNKAATLDPEPPTKAIFGGHWPIGPTAVLLLCGLLVGCGEKEGPPEDGQEKLAQSAPSPTSATRPHAAPTAAPIAAGEDFYRNAVGEWLQKTPAPTGRSSFGPLTEIYETAQTDLLTMLSERARPGDTPTLGTLKTLFRSYADIETIRSRKLAPVDLKLAILDDAQTVPALVLSMARADLGAILPLSLEVRPDIASTSAFALYISQGTLGHSPEVYSAPEFTQQRARYRYEVQARLAQIGIPNAQKRAEHIVSLEDALAEKYASTLHLETPQFTYNILPPEDLKLIAPALPWADILSEQRVEIATPVIVETPDALKRLSLAVEAAPLSVWRDYAKVRLLNHYSFVLPPAPSVPQMTKTGTIINKKSSAFLSRTERSLKQIIEQAPDALAAAYVEEYGQGFSKQPVEALVTALNDEMTARITNLSWMSDGTRRAASQKFKRLRMKIAYPDQVSIEPLPDLAEKDAFENFQKMEARKFTMARRRLLEGNAQTFWPVRPDEPFLRYSLNRNEISVPLALLRSPVYDPDRPSAENYGALGTLVAHELWHSIDARGRKADAEGFMDDWWTTADEKQYDRQTETLRAQLVAAGLNPDLHLDEVAGDIAGLQIAYAAFLNQSPAQDTSPDTAKQVARRFFYGWANVMKRRYRDGEPERRKFTDPHPIARLRVNIALQNVDAWYDAFDVTEVDGMYLPPEDRFSPW